MQQTLVDIEDKPALFAGSRDWVGSNEICYVIDTIYNVSPSLGGFRRDREGCSGWCDGVLV